MRVGIVGAGAVGGFLAVALAAGGADVVLVGRSALALSSEMALVRRDGSRLEPGARLVTTRDLGELAGCDVVLVTVKAQDTDAVGRALAGVISATPVVSFQNGIDNVARLRAHLDGPVLGGVVGFNVACDGPLRLQLTTGPLQAERSDAVRALAAPLRRAGVHLRLDRHIERRIAGKLLINLVNGVAAATGLGTRALLGSADARSCAAECIREGLSVMRAAGLRPALVGHVSPRALTGALLLPDRVLTPFVRLFVDPAARASTLQDLDREKPTEIEELNGAIVALAQRAGRDAPVNRLVTDLVRRHRQEGFIAPHELRARIEAVLPHKASRKTRMGARSTSRRASS